MPIPNDSSGNESEVLTRTVLVTECNLTDVNVTTNDSVVCDLNAGTTIETSGSDIG